MDTGTAAQHIGLGKHLELVYGLGSAIEYFVLGVSPSPHDVDGKRFTVIIEIVAFCAHVIRTLTRWELTERALPLNILNDAYIR